MLDALHDAPVVQVHLDIRQAKPLLGQIRIEDDPEVVAFAGWLELLQVLSDLLAHQPRQLGPAGDGELAEKVGDVRFHGSS